MRDMKTIVVSGYFDPLHAGHIKYFKAAKELGDKLIVIVNNDHQAQLKKGKSFMPEQERLEIIKSLRMVDEAVLALDQDRTVRRTLQKLADECGHAVFANGGDVNEKCAEEGIENVEFAYGVGGGKVQSSSWLTGGRK